MPAGKALFEKKGKRYAKEGAERSAQSEPEKAPPKRWPDGCIVDERFAIDVRSLVSSELEHRKEAILENLEAQFAYPMFVKPAGTGSSVGVSKAADADHLWAALVQAGKFDEKILVEEFIHGREVEVAVMGNSNPVASVCGEIDSGAEFYDYDAKYITDTSVAYIPARISEETAEYVREQAVKVYSAIGCQGLSRVDFFVTYADQRVVFNVINTLPGFTSISMFPKLFAASGIPYDQLIDQLLELALEA